MAVDSLTIGDGLQLFAIFGLGRPFGPPSGPPSGPTNLHERLLIGPFDERIANVAVRISEMRGAKPAPTESAVFELLRALWKHRRGEFARGPFQGLVDDLWRRKETRNLQMARAMDHKSVAEGICERANEELEEWREVKKKRKVAKGTGFNAIEELLEELGIERTRKPPGPGGATEDGGGDKSKKFDLPLGRLVEGEVAKGDKAEPGFDDDEVIVVCQVAERFARGEGALSLMTRKLPGARRRPDVSLQDYDQDHDQVFHSGGGAEPYPADDIADLAREAVSLLESHGPLTESQGRTWLVDLLAHVCGLMPFLCFGITTTLRRLNQAGPAPDGDPVPHCDSALCSSGGCALPAIRALTWLDSRFNPAVAAEELPPPDPPITEQLERWEESLAALRSRPAALARVNGLAEALGLQQGAAEDVRLAGEAVAMAARLAVGPGPPAAKKDEFLAWLIYRDHGGGAAAGALTKARHDRVAREEQILSRRLSEAEISFAYWLDRVKRTGRYGDVAGEAEKAWDELVTLRRSSGNVEENDRHFGKDVLAQLGKLGQAVRAARVAGIADPSLAELETAARKLVHHGIDQLVGFELAKQLKGLGKILRWQRRTGKPDDWVKETLRG